MGCLWALGGCHVYTTVVWTNELILTAGRNFCLNSMRFSGFPIFFFLDARFSELRVQVPAPDPILFTHVSKSPHKSSASAHSLKSSHCSVVRFFMNPKSQLQLNDPIVFWHWEFSGQLSVSSDEHSSKSSQVPFISI